jgi:hypothetical protein
VKQGIMIFFISLSCACSRGKYYVSNTFREGDPLKLQSVTLDSSYRFYTRTVYKDKNENRENVLRSNVSNADTANKIRIEVEYLLISWTDKNVIYITTVPDKFQSYYSTHILPDSIINAYDFSTFHFGKLNDDGETVSFIAENGITKINWQLRPVLSNNFPKQISLRELSIEKKQVVTDVILVDRALQEPVVFTRQPNYTIVFSRPENQGEYQAALNCRLSENKIYFYPYKRGIDIYFRFCCNINLKDSTIGFSYKRTLYNPGPLTAGSH